MPSVLDNFYAQLPTEVCSQLKLGCNLFIPNKHRQHNSLLKLDCNLFAPSKYWEPSGGAHTKHPRAPVVSSIRASTTLRCTSTTPQCMPIYNEHVHTGHQLCIHRDCPTSMCAWPNSLHLASINMSTQGPAPCVPPICQSTNQ